jgi:hypothetical protein
MKVITAHTVFHRASEQSGYSVLRAVGSSGSKRLIEVRFGQNPKKYL